MQALERSEQVEPQAQESALQGPELGLSEVLYMQEGLLEVELDHLQVESVLEQVVLELQVAGLKEFAE